jgi:hypothetical protein
MGPDEDRKPWLPLYRLLLGENDGVSVLPVNLAATAGGRLQ